MDHVKGFQITVNVRGQPVCQIITSNVRHFHISSNFTDCLPVGQHSKSLNKLSTVSYIASRLDLLKSGSLIWALDVFAIAFQIYPKGPLIFFISKMRLNLVYSRLPTKLAIFYEGYFEP